MEKNRTEIVISMLKRWVDAVPEYIRRSDEVSSTSFYGVGCSGHWSVLVWFYKLHLYLPVMSIKRKNELF